MSKQKNGAYCRIKRFGNDLEKKMGDGAETLKYQPSRNNYPPYYYDPADPANRVYSFSAIKTAVTPILDPGSAEILKSWEARVGGEEAKQIRDEAFNAGNMGHSMLERFNAGKSVGPYPLKMAGYVEALTNDILPHLNPSSSPIAFVDDNGELVTLSEIFVVDFERQFLGRLDMVTEIARKPFNGCRVLLELKGSRNEKKFEHMRVGIIQAVAYMTTFNKIASLFPDRVLPLDGVAMAYMYSSGNGEIIPVLGEELQEYVDEWEQWLSCFHDSLTGDTAA